MGASPIMVVARLGLLFTDHFARSLFTEAAKLLIWCVQVVGANASGMPIAEEPLVPCLWNNSMCDHPIFLGKASDFSLHCLFPEYTFVWRICWFCWRRRNCSSDVCRLSILLRIVEWRFTSLSIPRLLGIWNTRPRCMQSHTKRSSLTGGGGLVWLACAESQPPLLSTKCPCFREFPAIS